MREILEWARVRYEAIILDSPPVLAVSDAMSLAQMSDHLLLVVRSKTTHRNAVTTALRELRTVRDRPLGTILNAISLRDHPRYGQGDYLAYYRLSTRYLRS
jgi:Mrp family chromosome partitioning ATPase